MSDEKRIIEGSLERLEADEILSEEFEIVSG